MAAKKAHAFPDRLTLYEKAVAAYPEVELKGAANAYTSLNGNMFSILHADGVLGLRLPEDAREKFLKKYSTQLVEKYGIVQKEYVVVPDEVLSNAKAFKKYIGISYEYAKTLKPKPTTKSKKDKDQKS